jgi:SOS-response transcriptional repressor LexA
MNDDAAMRYIYRMKKNREFLPGSLAWRIDRRLKALGKKPTPASVEAGLSSSAIRNILDGQSKQGRSDTLNALAPVLETSVEWLSTGLGPETTRPAVDAAPQQAEKVPFSGDLNVNRLYVRRIAEAGNWREYAEFQDEEEPESFIVPMMRNDGRRRFLTKIAGDSMDKLRLFDGDFAVTIDWNDIERPAQDGEVVVVEQLRDGGHIIETTIKQIRIHKDRYELHPRSSNPKHKAIVVRHGDGERDGREVRIIGLVESIYRPISPLAD